MTFYIDLYSGEQVPFLTVMQQKLIRWYWHGVDGDASFTPASVTNYTFPRKMMFYRNLTIGANAQLWGADIVQYVFVSGTLTLDGSINRHVGALGGNPGSTTSGAGGHGGNGGGALIIIANEITGSGYISVNGANALSGTGTASTAYYGSNGADGAFKGITVGGGGGGTVTSGSRGFVGVDSRFFIFDMLENILSDGYGGGGGGGAVGTGASGGGGAGIIGIGGLGGLTGGGAAGGGGGGGAGLLVLMSNSDVPNTISLYAEGGNGGSGPVGGGGGGGGLIVVISPSDESVKSVSGGAAGTSTATAVSLPPEAGRNGKAVSIKGVPVL